MSPARLRIVTLNVWNNRGPAVKRLAHCAAQLAALSPDIVLLQEVRSARSCDQAAFLAEALRAQVVFESTDEQSAGGPIGNAILTRLPLRSRAARRLPAPPGDWRCVVAATVETEQGALVVASTHLSWELDRASVREAQVVMADAFVRGLPSSLPRVMGGDFNCAPDSDVVRFLTGRTCLGGQATFWRDAFARKHPHEDGWTWARRNPYVATHIEPDRRIDYIFVGAPQEDGTGTLLDARVVLDEPDENGLFPSDHFGVYAEMGLVPCRRDF